MQSARVSMIMPCRPPFLCGTLLLTLIQTWPASHRARSIFYLAEGAREGGSISFDELEVICKAGGLPPMVAVTMAESLREIDQTDVQFVDFLACVTSLLLRIPSSRAMREVLRHCFLP